MSSSLRTEFFETVLHRLLSCMRKRQPDNFDFNRFSFDGVDRSNDFNAAYHEQNLSLFIANHERFEQTWNSLKDQQSRDLFLELILWRLAGHLHVRLSTNNALYWHLHKDALTVPSVPSRLDFTGVFGPLRHYDEIRAGGRRLKIDCWPGSIAHAFFLKQYFFQRDGVAIAPDMNEQVIDGGALFGDTALAFAAAVGELGRVYSFDPLESHAKIVTHNISQNGFQDHVRFFPVGLAAVGNDVVGPVSTEQIVNPGFTLEGTSEVDRFPLRTLDGLVAGGAVERVDFLKLDIEGSELGALEGAKETLREFRPKLAISVYHKFSDFFEIPAFIDSLGLHYDLYLDHYTIHSEETILYGIPARE